MSETIYKLVTERIVNELEAGTIPWHRPWNSPGTPKNLKTGKDYRGVNVLILNCAQYGSPYWLTYLQTREMGGVVRKGEKGFPIVFWKLLHLTDPVSTGREDSKQVPVLRYYTVFNVQQTEGIEIPVQLGARTFQPVEEAERIVSGMQNRPIIHNGFSQAFYRPSIDTIHLPVQSAFESSEEYYSVVFHELTHSTGHASRLNRFAEDARVAPFGSPEYSREELIAELGAAFLCAKGGIEHVTIKNSAAYIKGWLETLENDHRLIVNAAGQAQKAADYILGTRSTEVES
jgi:antirestriction protein ArdC